jgi:hypothetical protein
LADTNSHKAELVKLPDDDAKIALFKEIVAKSLSVRALGEQVRQVRDGHASAGKKNRGFYPEQFLKNPIFTDENGLRNMNPLLRESYLQDVSEMLDRLTKYVVQCNKIKQLLESITDDGEKNT